MFSYPAQRAKPEDSDSDENVGEEDALENERKFQEKLKKNRKQPRNTRQGISAEVYGQFNKKKTFVAPVVEKN